MSDNFFRLSNVNTDKTILFECKIYPKPTSGKFTIELPESFYFEKITYVIKDLTGKILTEEKAFSEKEEIDLSTYANGIYIITIRTKDKVLTAKLVKE